MRIRVLLLIILMLPFIVYTENVDIDNVIYFFEKKVDKNLVISVENITYKDLKLSSDFSVYITNLLSEQIRKSNKFKEFSKRDLEKILEQLELNSSDIFNEKDKAKIGELKSVQGIITGEYIITDEQVLMFLRLVSVQKGITVESATVSIPKSKIPSGLALLPSNYEVVKSNNVDRGIVDSINKQDFQIKVWTQKGEGGFYKDGEKLKVFFKSNYDCYVRLYHIDVYGKKKLIFPNRYYPKDKKIVADKVYVIPDETMDFEFELGEPYGTEQIVVLGSTLPFNDNVEPFVEIDENINKLVAKTFMSVKDNNPYPSGKGVNVKSVERKSAIARVFYTIVKGN